METTLLALCVAVIAGLIGGFALAYVYLQPQIQSLQNELNAVSNEFNSLSTTVSGIGAAISDIQRQVINLNSSVEILEDLRVQLPPPDYDSGWVENTGCWPCTLYHGLNTTEVFVYFYVNGAPTSYNITHYRYGDEYWWSLNNENEIAIYCNPAPYMEEYRVLIWKIAEP